MKVLVILAHPSLESFNHAIAEASVKALRQKRYALRSD
jgi:putative NADPH-quinone reductase